MNEEPRLRAAVIGCGFIGCGTSKAPEAVGIMSHSDAYMASEGAELVALCDASEHRLHQMRARFPGVPTCISIDECLERYRPELVSIATPDDTHFEIALRACRFPSVSGMLLEKPLALTSDQGMKIIHAATEYGVALSVNYTRRFTKRFQQLAHEVKQGLIGKIQSVIGTYTKGILHNGSHWIDLLDMFGVTIESVQAFGRVQDQDSEPTPSVRFRCDSVEAFLVGCDRRHFTVFEMDLIGTTGRLRMLEGGYQIELYRAEPSPLYSGYTTLSTVEDSAIEGMQDAMLYAVDDLVRSVKHCASPLCTGETAIRSLLVGEAVLESLHRGSRVDVGRVP